MRYALAIALLLSACGPSDPIPDSELSEPNVINDAIRDSLIGKK